jgi:site-specific DNA recombinase
MIRAAIYARFSSKQQNVKSVEDQIALCREVCAREDMAVVMCFEDRAISGAATVNRPGFLSMMRAAEAKLFDVIVFEDLDRVFRDQADYHTARKQLDFLGIAIHSVTGKVGKMDGAMRALMSEMFIENLVVHVRRGMQGVLRDGRHAGGRAYGYEPVPNKPGELRTVEHEAEVVRDIFAEFVNGASPRKIAKKLNAKSVKAPRGDAWSANTINGNLQRGGGILLNELYAGRIVWNKVRMVKDPKTGKRLSRPNPKSEHRIVDAPHLRIVDEQTWQAAQKIKQANSKTFGPTKGRPKRPFSGLIRCASCGGAMVMAGGKNGGRVQCSKFKEKCKNGRRVPVAKIESLETEILRKTCHKIINDAPTFFIEREIAVRLEAQPRLIEENDLRDMQTFCAVVAYADIVVAENLFSNLATQAGLHKKFETVVTTNLLALPEQIQRLSGG